MYDCVHQTSCTSYYTQHVRECVCVCAAVLLNLSIRSKCYKGQHWSLMFNPTTCFWEAVFTWLLLTLSRVCVYISVASTLGYWVTKLWLVRWAAGVFVVCGNTSSLGGTDKGGQYACFCQCLSVADVLQKEGLSTVHVHLYAFLCVHEYIDFHSHVWLRVFAQVDFHGNVTVVCTCTCTYPSIQMSLIPMMLKQLLDGITERHTLAVDKLVRMSVTMLIKPAVTQIPIAWHNAFDVKPYLTLFTQSYFTCRDVIV